MSDPIPDDHFLEARRAAFDRWSLFINDNLQSAIESTHDVGEPVPLLSRRPMRPDRPSVVGPGECSLGDDPALFADIAETQAALHNDAIEAGIVEWSRTWKRPEFDGETEIYFLFRLQIGLLVVEHVLKEGRDWSESIGEPPDPENRSEFLLWLLIHVWNRIGLNAVRDFADKDLRRSAEGSEPPR